MRKVKLSICLSEEEYRHLLKWSVQQKKKLPTLVRSTLLDAADYGHVNLVIKAFPRPQPTEDKIIAICGSNSDPAA
jgi:hypothetical protein